MRPRTTIHLAARPLLSALGLALLAGAAGAQSSPVFGVELIGDNFFRTESDDFLGQYTSTTSVPEAVRALDFDAQGNELWGIDRYTLEYGRFDLTTGDFVPEGTVFGPLHWVTGLTASLIAQGLSLWDAACLGVHLHGLAGDLAADDLGEMSLTALDLIDYIPDALGNALE